LGYFTYHCLITYEFITKNKVIFDSGLKAVNNIILCGLQKDGFDVDVNSFATANLDQNGGALQILLIQSNTVLNKIIYFN